MHLSSLTSIMIGYSSFIQTESFVVKGLERLYSLSVGSINTYSASFYMSTVVIEGSEHSSDPN